MITSSCQRCRHGIPCNCDQSESERILPPHFWGVLGWIGLGAIIVTMAIVGCGCAHAQTAECNNCYTLTVPTKPLPPPDLVYAPDGKMVFTLHANGKIDLGEGVTNDQAAAAFWKAVREIGFQCPKVTP